MNYNKVMLAGNLCADAEVKKGNSGDFSTFTLAVSQGKDKDTDFIPCVAFGKLAEIAGKYLTKGKPVFLEGKFSSRKVDKITYYGVTVFNIQFLGSGEKSEKSTKPKQSNDNPFM